MKKVKMNFLWKDRRRRMGLPLSFTRYALTEDRLFLDTGFFNLRSEEILLYRVRDINLRRSLWQRICGVGSIRVLSSDKSTPDLLIKNVKNPLEVEEMKISRRVRLGEVMGDIGDADDFDGADDLD